MRSARRGPAPAELELKQLKSLLRNTPAALNAITAKLSERGMLAVSRARQLAQIAITSRCGRDAGHGVFYLELLSQPTIPGKVYSKKLTASPAEPAANYDPLFRNYKGFITPLSALSELPERHSFLDLLEKLLVSSLRHEGEKSIMEREGISLGAIKFFGHIAEVTFYSRRILKETIKYSSPGS